jgi:hypothetical protein
MLQRYTTQQNDDHVITTLARGNNSWVNAPNLTKMTCTPYYVRFIFLTAPKWKRRTTQKVYVGHLHQYSKSVPMVWDPKTKLVSQQFHVMFDDNFDTVQATRGGSSGTASSRASHYKAGGDTSASGTDYLGLSSA